MRTASGERRMVKTAAQSSSVGTFERNHLPFPFELRLKTRIS
jgi:hypothetical protein